MKIIEIELRHGAQRFLPFDSVAEHDEQLTEEVRSRAVAAVALVRTRRQRSARHSMGGARTYPRVIALGVLDEPRRRRREELPLEVGVLRELGDESAPHDAEARYVPVLRDNNSSPYEH